MLKCNVNVAAPIVVIHENWTINCRGPKIVHDNICSNKALIQSLKLRRLISIFDHVKAHNSPKTQLHTGFIMSNRGRNENCF